MSDQQALIGLILRVAISASRGPFKRAILMYLVTGASGFIGGHLVDTLLARGVAVRCFVRPTSKVADLERPGVELVRGDLFDERQWDAALQGVQVVFHLAATLAEANSQRMFRVNGGGTQVVARACARQSEPPVLIYLSSLAAAGPTRVGRLRHEADPAAPVSVYGQSKRLGELAIREVAAQVPTTILRPGIVFGERGREMLPVFQAIHRFRFHLVPSLSPPPLSYIHVHDLVELMIRAAEHGERLVPNPKSSAEHAQGYFFACVDEHPDYGRFGRLIADALGHPHLLVMPCIEPLVWTFAGCSQLVTSMAGRTSMFNLDKMREALADSWACANQRSRDRLGFVQSGTLQDQVQATADWYRASRWL